MSLWPYPIKAGLRLWMINDLDPDNSVAWSPRWAEHGVTAKDTWADRLLIATEQAARSQRRVAHHDAGQHVLEWLMRHPFQVHQWGCPDPGCGPDKPKPTGFLIKVFKQKITDAARKNIGDPKVTVNGKQIRLYPETFEIPASALIQIDENHGWENESIEVALDRVQTDRGIGDGGRAMAIAIQRQKGEAAKVDPGSLLPRRRK